MSNFKVEQVPVLHVRGTNYQVGFSIGRTFKSLIEDFLETWDDFRGSLIPAYESGKGKNIYDSCLNFCRDKYPQYMQEIQGISDGSSIPFYKIFLLHIESLIIQNDEKKDAGSTGCTSIICNHDDIILGHTEDAAPEMLYNFFIVCAQIVDDAGETVENFSTLTYPGYLPGYTMGFNSHGIVYSVNTLTPTPTFPDRTPVHFITRALLGARTKEECVSIIKDEGTGIADGFSLNLISVNEGSSEPIICNIEVGPSQSDKKESEISILNVQNGSSSVHCNKYLRLNMFEKGSMSSNRRHAAIELLPLITTLENVKNTLSNQSDETFPVYRNVVPLQKNSDSGVRGYDHDYAATVAVGIFDIKKKTWSIYANKPEVSKPVVVLPMNFQ